MNYALTELKEQHPWLRKYHSTMLQMVGKQVAAARKTAKRLLNVCRTGLMTDSMHLPTTRQALKLREAGSRFPR